MSKMLDVEVNGELCTLCADSDLICKLYEMYPFKVVGQMALVLQEPSVDSQILGVCLRGDIVVSAENPQRHHSDWICLPENSCVRAKKGNRNQGVVLKKGGWMLVKHAQFGSLLKVCSSVEIEEVGNNLLAGYFLRDWLHSSSKKPNLPLPETTSTTSLPSSDNLHTEQKAYCFNCRKWGSHRTQQCPNQMENIDQAQKTAAHLVTEDDGSNADGMDNAGVRSEMPMSNEADKSDVKAGEPRVHFEKSVNEVLVDKRTNNDVAGEPLKANFKKASKYSSEPPPVLDSASDEYVSSSLYSWENCPSTIEARHPYSVVARLVLVLRERRVGSKVLGIYKQDDMILGTPVGGSWVWLPGGSRIRRKEEGRRHGTFFLLNGGWMLTSHPRYGTLLEACSTQQSWADVEKVETVKPFGKDQISTLETMPDAVVSHESRNQIGSQPEFSSEEEVSNLHWLMKIGKGFLWKSSTDTGTTDTCASDASSTGALDAEAVQQSATNTQPEVSASSTQGDDHSEQQQPASEHVEAEHEVSSNADRQCNSAGIVTCSDRSMHTQDSTSNEQGATESQVDKVDKVVSRIKNQKPEEKEVSPQDVAEVMVHRLPSAKEIQNAPAGYPVQPRMTADVDPPQPERQGLGNTSAESVPAKHNSSSKQPVRRVLSVEKELAGPSIKAMLSMTSFCVVSKLALVLEERWLGGTVLGVYLCEDLVVTTEVQNNWVWLPPGSCARQKRDRQRTVILHDGGWMLMKHARYGTLLEPCSSDVILDEMKKNDNVQRQLSKQNSPEGIANQEKSLDATVSLGSSARKPDEEQTTDTSNSFETSSAHVAVSEQSSPGCSRGTSKEENLFAYREISSPEIIPLSRAASCPPDEILLSRASSAASEIHRVTSWSSIHLLSQQSCPTVTHVVADSVNGRNTSEEQITSWGVISATSSAASSAVAGASTAVAGASSAVAGILNIGTGLFYVGAAAPTSLRTSNQCAPKSSAETIGSQKTDLASAEQGSSRWQWIQSAASSFFFGAEDSSAEKPVYPVLKVDSAGFSDCGSSPIEDNNAAESLMNRLTPIPLMKRVGSGLLAGTESPSVSSSTSSPSRKSSKTKRMDEQSPSLIKRFTSKLTPRNVLNKVSSFGSGLSKKGAKELIPESASEPNLVFIPVNDCTRAGSLIDEQVITPLTIEALRSPEVEGRMRRIHSDALISHCGTDFDDQEEDEEIVHDDNCFLSPPMQELLRNPSNPFLSAVTVAIVAEGTRGDVQPIAALAAALKGKGFNVVILTNRNHMVIFRSVGLECYGVFRDIELVWKSPELRAAASKGNTVQMLEAMQHIDPVDMQLEIESFWDTMIDARPHLIMYGPLSVFLARAFSTEYGIPSLRYGLQPFVPTKDYAPPGGKNFEIGAMNYRYWRQVNAVWYADQVQRAPHLEYYLGMPAGSLTGTAEDEFQQLVSPDPGPALAGYSPLVAPPGSDNPPEQLQVTGFWCLSAEAQGDKTPFGKSQSTELLRFLMSGEEPVYLGWGSMVSHSPENTARLAVRAVKLVGARAIILAGWAGLGADLLAGEEDGDELQKYAEENVLFLKAAAHEALFGQCCLTVHHGGAGTTAAALRSGKPTIVTPVFCDQPFWAERVEALGVGVKLPQLHRITAEQLADGIVQCQSEEMQENAAELGRQLREEDGLGAAVSVVSQIVRDLQLGANDSEESDDSDDDMQYSASRFSR